MVFDRECLGKKICQVVNAFSPNDVEFLQVNAIAKPVELHVNAFGALRGDGVAGNAARYLIVDEDVGGRLWVTEIVQCFGECQHRVDRS